MKRSWQQKPELEIVIKVNYSRDFLYQIKASEAELATKKLDKGCAFDINVTQETKTTRKYLIHTQKHMNACVCAKCFVNLLRYKKSRCMIVRLVEDLLL